MTMKAIVYQGHKSVAYKDVPDAAIQAAGDAVVKIEKTAICGSDLHIYHGPDRLDAPDFTLGHEFLGTIEDVGSDVRRFKKGDRVLVSCTIGCGACVLCDDNLYSGCLESTKMGPVTNIFGSPLNPGGQAEAVRVPFADTNIFKIPDELEDEQVLFLTDILPTGYMGADLAEVSPGDTVVVIGCGPVGVFAQISALVRGAAVVIAVDLDDGRLQKAEARGCRPLNPSKENLSEVVKSMTAGKGADCSIEAVGSPATVGMALDVVRAGGRVAIIGVVAGQKVEIDWFPVVTGKNLTIRSGIVNPQFYIPKLLPMIEQGRIDPAEIITHRMSLSDGARGYEIFDNHEEDVLKVVLTP
ncbi:MAG: threonine dehydrogenase-like Zn-dependent dehydrogenase [Candidatus Azotimanducaceae bacterium]|jgi:threonine dehydrogenase-like Zn-dependent dehydrogenase